MLDFDKAGGLVSAIAQDAATGEVLMIAWMNEEAFAETVRTRRAVYFSRSRKKLWRKGEESGNVQEVRDIFVDCDNDAVLLKVNQIGGAACHEGYKSCFFRRIEADGWVAGRRHHCTSCAKDIGDALIERLAIEATHEPLFDLSDLPSSIDHDQEP
jgi:phosphoribosyl-AMP cyclohydrolase